MEEIEKIIKASLEKVPGIYVAFAYGPFPGNPQDLEREIDILVVGDPDLHELDEIISDTEKKIGRAIHVLSYTLREFRQRITVKDGVVLGAVEGPKVILIGTENQIREV